MKRVINPSDWLRIRELLEQWGSDPLGAYTLLPDKRFWFDAERASAVAYVIHGRVALVLGDPLGDTDASPFAICQFCDFCRQRRLQPAFYQVTPRYLTAYRSSGLTVLKIGEDAVIDLTSFSLQGKRFQDLRTARNKMARLGIVCEELTGTDKYDPTIVAQLREISDQWLHTHRAREMSFSMGGFAPDERRFQDTRVLVARRVSDRAILGFLTFVPIYAGHTNSCPYRSGWGLDLMRTFPHPGGLVEFLLTEAALQFQCERAQILSLGLCGLADTAKSEETELDHPRISSVLRRLYAWSPRIYSFRNLYAFKNKFGPQWEPRYVTLGGSYALLPVFYALLWAHTRPTIPE